MSNFTFVLDTTKKPLDPIHPGKARLLLKQLKAAVFRFYPFTIILTLFCHSRQRKNRNQGEPGL